MKISLHAAISTLFTLCALPVMAVNGNAPGGVTKVKFAHDYNGAPTIGITFCAPVETSDGSDLTSITELRVYRESELLTTFTAPQPGENLSLTDTAPQKGDYTYHFVAANSYGDGDDVGEYTYVGADIAAPVTNVRMWEDPQNPGTAVIAWDAPTTYQEGSPINPELVKYEILAADGLTSLRDNITDTTTSFNICEANDRQLCNFFIISVTEKPNYTYYSMTPLLAVGKAYDSDYAESFAGAAPSTVSGGLNDFLRGSWAAAATASAPSATPYDNDGGMMTYKPRKAGNESRWYSGKIALPAEVDDALWSFRYFASTTSKAVLQPFVYADGELHYAPSFPQKGDGTWQLAQMDLSPYRGKNLQVGVYVVAGDKEMTLIDDVALSVSGAPEVQLAMFDVPPYIYVQEEAVVKVTLSNRSTHTQKVKVSLMCGSEFGGGTYEIAPNGSKQLEFGWYADTDKASSEEIQLLVYDDNDNLLCSEERTLNIRHKGYPVPRNVETHTAGQRTIITWTAPDYTSTYSAESVDEDFESYESFAIDTAGDWKFADLDGVAETYSFTDFSFPNMGKPMAWIVFDNAGMNNTFATTSGEKCMASFSSPYGGNDNWLISPDLSADGGTISFNARSYSASEPEDLDVYYSTTTDRPEAFILLESMREIPASWQTYTFSLPKGSNYFAIRSSSNDKFFIMLDDVHYTRGIGHLSLEGYRVFKNYNEVAAIDASVTSVELDSPVDSSARYHVKAVYSRGLSDFSMGATPGVGVVSATVSDVRYHCEHGVLYISNPHGEEVTIVTAAGVTVYNGCDTELRIALSDGVYIAGDRKGTRKILMH